MKIYLTENEYKEKTETLIKELQKYQSKLDAIEDKIEYITDELEHLRDDTIIY